MPPAALLSEDTKEQQRQTAQGRDKTYDPQRTRCPRCCPQNPLPEGEGTAREGEQSENHLVKRLARGHERQALLVRRH